MTDWKSIARALELNIPEQDMDRTLAPLESLEPLFRRVAATVADGQELAVTFDPAPDDPDPEEAAR